MQIIRDYWQAMNGNDWAAVAARFLAPDYRCIWPQTAEIITGRDGFAAVNGAFPGQGGWRFQMLALTGSGDQAASDTRITHPELGITARAVSFHQIRDGLIAQQTEFWPEPYDAPAWRKGLTRIDPALAGL
ncbi:nuclear transport factor 2 family protein [Paracoccus jiaweipingae]|uniref:nuclear transport factor 2 family protein n=1 Tax=unclassified Paracoccus (in: a-proteobacteria) TaxID=2688777 RepID=UPI00379185E0